MAARVLRDGWTVELDVSGPAGTVNMTKVSASGVRPSVDIYNIAYDLGTTVIRSGVASNANPWWDASNPVPGSVTIGGIVTVTAHLNGPLRKGDIVTVTVAPGLMPGGAGGVVVATNNSDLRPARYGEDRYTGYSDMIAGIDCAAGCRKPRTALIPASTITTSAASAIRRFNDCIVIGLGAADATQHVLQGYDLRASANGGQSYYVSMNCQNPVVRDCLFDDIPTDCISYVAGTLANGLAEWVEMEGLKKAANGAVSDGHARFAGLSGVGAAVYSHARIYASNGDGINIANGVIQYCHFDDMGWDSRAGSAAHTDLILVQHEPDAGNKVLIKNSHFDSYGQQTGSPWKDPGYVYPYGAITGAFGFDIPGSQAFPGIGTAMNGRLSVNNYTQREIEVTNCVNRANQVSYDITQTIRTPTAIGFTPDIDYRLAFGLYVHDTLMQAPPLQVGATPYYPDNRGESRHSPDNRFVNVRRPDGSVWTMGPQPADATYTMSVSSSNAGGGDTVTWSIAIGRYFAPYGPVTIDIAESGSGFNATLAADIAIMIALFTAQGVTGLSYATLTATSGRLTIAHPFRGYELGQYHEGAILRIARAMKSAAAGNHSLTLSNNSVGTITVASATVAMAAPPTAPINTVLPAISGSVVQGQTLTCSDGTWSASPTGYAYQWKRGASAISGATSATYDLVAADIGSNISCTVTATNGIGSTSATSAAVGPVVGTDVNVTSVNANGWSVTHAAAGVLNPLTPLYVSRQGYDQSGSAKTYLDMLTLTQRIRKPYDAAYSTAASAYLNVATVSGNWLTSDQIALSDYVYSTDTVIGGATNNSTQTSPKPVCAWARPDKRTIGDTLLVEIVAAHRDARNNEQVACVTFSVTDGSTTITQTVATSTVLGHTLDLNPIVGYAATLNTSGFSDGTALTVNAKVYPWIGTSGSIADSSAGTAGARGFNPQTYVKNTAKVTAPYLAYVSPTGTDRTVNTSGVATVGGATKISQTPSVANVEPFATLGSAMIALKAATILTGGVTDGCEIRLMAGANATGVPSAQTYQSAAELILRADPAATPGTVSLSLAANWATRHSYLRFKDLVLNRTSSSQINMNTNSFVTFENCSYANGAANFAICAGGSAGNPVVVRTLGLAVTGGGSAALFGATSSFECRLLRGLSGSGFNLDNACVLGSTITNSVTSASAAYGDSGSFIGFSRIMGYAGTGTPIGTRVDASAPDVAGMALIQNVLEWISATSNAMFKPSADTPAVPSITHLVCHQNTFAGYWNYGRGNILYNEGALGARAHVLQSLKGNIHVQVNTKHDVFKQDGTRTQSWAYLYGVGCAGEVSLYADANSTQNGTGSHFSQAYPGLNAAAGSSTTVSLDAKFTDFKATSWAGTANNPTAGVGGGTYTLSSGSVAFGRLGTPVLRFDLAANERLPANSAAGAYELAA